MTLFKVTQPVRGKHCTRLRPPDYEVNYILHITSNCPLSEKLPLVFLLNALLKAEKVFVLYTQPLSFLTFSCKVLKGTDRPYFPYA